jgi:rhodanese-related sulfurtransferase
MTAEQNHYSITPVRLNQSTGKRFLVDVRKLPARQDSGLEIPCSIYRHPFDAFNWAKEFTGRSAVVYCVHGHEISQSVAGFLRDQGVEAVYLEGGFEAWRVLGFSVWAIGARQND